MHYVSDEQLESLQLQGACKKRVREKVRRIGDIDFTAELVLFHILFKGKRKMNSENQKR